jgi:hypothetical protein
VRRWQLFTGRAAIHQASGQPFDQCAAGLGQDQSDCELITKALAQRLRGAADDFGDVVLPDADPRQVPYPLAHRIDRGVAEANATVCGYLFAAAKAVPTENRIRAGADAAMGYLAFGCLTS